MKGVHGFKVFNAEWVCGKDTWIEKQYTCPGKFEEDVDLELCNRGMHFCENVVDCFNYYSFNPMNKVAEVIAYGNVVSDGTKSATDKLEIVREIPWDEVLRLVNTGKECTGFCNTGHYNTGDRNTGHYNTGDRNTGNYNTGDSDTGNSNTGNSNTGNYNTGNRNTGDRNTANYNTGDRNTGHYNTGDRNTGNRNTGNRNTGNRNTGNWNTGDWNKSSFNTGCFMTKEQNIMMFNKPSYWTYRMWLDSEARCLLKQMPGNDVEWVYSEYMSDEEKRAHPERETTGGYLKELDEPERAQIWWDNLDDESKEIIKSLPNFDPDIFYQCTGIKIE